jgi:chemotaxis protein histidine kinase CheA
VTETKVFNLPNTLKTRSSKPGGRSFDDLAKAGDHVVRRNGSSYPTIAAGDIADLMAIVGRLRQGSPLAVELQECFRIAHDIRGQAGSFDFPLISAAAGSLSKFIDKLRNDPPDQSTEVISLIEVHAATMHLLLSQNRKGAGGPAEAQILDGLTRAVEKVQTTLGLS